VSLSPERLEKLNKKHLTADKIESQVKIKPIPNPFLSAKDPKKMSDLFSNKETKDFFDEFEKQVFDLRIPDSMSGYPLEKFKRINRIVAEENKRASAADNHTI